AVAPAGIDEQAARRRDRSGPRATGEQEARFVGGDLQDFPHARVGPYGMEHVLDLRDCRAHDEVAIRGARGEVLIEVARSDNGIDPPLLELHGIAVLLVHDRGVEYGVADLDSERGSDVLVGLRLVQRNHAATIARAAAADLLGDVARLEKRRPRLFSGYERAPPGNANDHAFGLELAQCSVHRHARDVELEDEEVLGGQALRVAPLARTDPVDDELLDLLI